MIFVFARSRRTVRRHRLGVDETGDERKAVGSGREGCGQNSKIEIIHYDGCAGRVDTTAILVDILYKGCPQADLEDLRREKIALKPSDIKTAGSDK